MATILQNTRYGFRVLLKNPAYAGIAILTLALGIGFNSAIFSLVNAVILRPLPYPDPEQLVGLGQWRNQQGEGYIQTGVSAPNLHDIAKAGVFQDVAWYRWSRFNITEGNRPESVEGIRPPPHYCPCLALGRSWAVILASEDMQAGRDQVAVIGHRLWQIRYGADPNILGKSIPI